MGMDYNLLVEKVNMMSHHLSLLHNYIEIKYGHDFDQYVQRNGKQFSSQLLQNNTSNNTNNLGFSQMDQSQQSSQLQQNIPGFLQPHFIPIPTQNNTQNNNGGQMGGHSYTGQGQGEIEQSDDSDSYPSVGSSNKKKKKKGGGKGGIKMEVSRNNGEGSGTQKKPRISHDWEYRQEFIDLARAKATLEREFIYTTRHKSSTGSGDKIYYNCRLDSSCPVKMYLKLSNNDIIGKVSCYTNNQVHQHRYLNNNSTPVSSLLLGHPSTSSAPPPLASSGISSERSSSSSGKQPRGMNSDLKTVIIELVEGGINKPQQIIKELRKLGKPVPVLTQLKSFLAYRRAKVKQELETASPPSRLYSYPTFNNNQGQPGQGQSQGQGQGQQLTLPQQTLGIVPLQLSGLPMSLQIPSMANYSQLSQ